MTGLVTSRGNCALAGDVWSYLCKIPKVSFFAYWAEAVVSYFIHAQLFLFKQWSHRGRWWAL